MFCEECGNKIKDGHKFCIKCGYSIVSNSPENKKRELVDNEKWWHRLLKVLYIISYIPLLIIIPIVWSTNTCYYCSKSDSFWYSLLTLFIYVVIIRLIKIAILYVILGRRPKWKREFKKFF